ncbi:MAG: T6SS effector phospholipase Tle3 domain-containing protein [Telluria sp.]
MAEKPYPKVEHVAKRESTVLQCNRLRDKVIAMPRDTPGNIILVHGVNDVGTGYKAAEDGLCIGLRERLFRYFTPAEYKMPGQADKNKVEVDPDTVFFKRQAKTDTDSPVIPFYWGYRELEKKTRTVNGQKTDRYGTRLDKDLSKGGGPFGNATSSLPDMWNRGVYAAIDPVGDPLRPIKTGPGRMYMVLAAQRLAALIAMIRKFEPRDTVSIVAHSQGCLLCLLAQAFLMEKGERTADTLILTHPPYSLDEEMSIWMKGLTFFQGGSDAPMVPHYELIDGRQSLHARLQTLVNIVSGVTKSKAAAPAFAKINESDCGGMVASCWQPDGDRDNRGKVYLYFCPEDMTVALDNMRGIGWQGVPDYIQGTQYKQQVEIAYVPSQVPYKWMPSTVTRKPLSELGPGFFQRVFTVKRRQDLRTKKIIPVLVGQAPHDFALRIAGEDDHAHVAETVRSWRESLPVGTWPIDPKDKPEMQRQGIRAINGEPLHLPCEADLRGNQIDADKIPANSRLAKASGPCEEVDPITAAVAVTASPLLTRTVEVPDPAGQARYPGTPQDLPAHERAQVETAYNKAKGRNPADPNDKFTVVRAVRQPDGKVVAVVQESPNDARKRWQHELGEKSFHSAIFDSSANHCNVTAYDIAIGSGQASSHRLFYAYLCAVADWRLKKPAPRDYIRPGILTWEKFIDKHGGYYDCEPDWRKQLIEGNVGYYSTGELPSCLPVLTGKLWDIVISETTSGRRVNQRAAPKGQS